MDKGYVLLCFYDVANTYNPWTTPWHRQVTLLNIQRADPLMCFIKYSWILVFVHNEVFPRTIGIHLIPKLKWHNLVYNITLCLHWRKVASISRILETLTCKIWEVTCSQAKWITDIKR